MQSAAAFYGVVPFENSSNGSVLQTLDLLIDRDDDFPDIQVCAEVYMNVQHCLLGRASEPTSYDNESSVGSATPTTNTPFPREPRCKPVADLRHVKHVYSHPQALGQCEAFLSTYLKPAERHEVSSTSEAARIVAEDVSGETAAIASRLAAEVHQLNVLATGAQDVEDNTTRFLIIQKGPVNPDHQGSLPPKLHASHNPRKDRKALIAFSIDHETQGALANTLWIFKEHRLNLTSINSRPSRIRPWHYIFLVEFQGQEELKDPDLLQLVLNELNITTEGNKWLGCWVNRSGN